MRSRTWSRLRATLAVGMVAAVLSLGFMVSPAQAYPLKPSPVHYAHHGANSGGSAAPAPSGGVLPNTGGPALWILLAGVLLVVSGGVATAKGRKRNRPPAYPPIG